MYPALDAIRVLHVDDEPEFAATAAAFLERTDDRFEIETAANATEGLTRLSERPFDCVVSDYDMPGRNGLEFLESVREEYPDLPFVLFTGKGSEEVASEAISAGVSDYLQKEMGTSQYTLLANRIRNAVEQHRSRVALEESEKRLSLFIEQSPLGVVEYDEDFEIVRLNPAGEEIFGYTEAELRGETWEVFVTERSYENVDAVTDALSKATGGFHSIDENVRKDGTHIVCEWHNRVVTDEHGEVVAVFSQFQDITERTERERELESIRRRLEAILENTTTPMFMKDDRGAYVFVNRSFRELFGLDDEEIVGRTDRELFGESVDEEVMRNDRAVLERAEPVETEETVLIEGEERVFLSTKVPVYDTGDRSDPDDPVAVFGLAVDITERTERERELKRYERLVATMQEAACIYDAEGRFEFVNEYLAGFYGTTPEALEGRESGLVPHIRAEGDGDPYQELLDGEREEFDGETEIELRGRGPEILQYTLTPLRIDGRIERVIGVAHEVTAFKERERELERKNERLDSFTRVVSHDLRNPLSVADGRLALAMDACDSEHLPPAARAVRRSQALVEDLLTLARDGDRATETTTVDLAALVSECWDATTSDATLRVETERSLRTDANRLRQLLENLLTNAVDHGGTTVTVGDLPDGFHVSDDGPGVSPTERERVFEAGYSTSRAGIGFGLAIVQEVAEAHGWTVHVTDSDAGGARFEVRGVETTE
ncbi:hybrid sensor histidine kinase/response regulator [Salinigranum rubrum]|uniref:histidine kinase n=1 Tax=Salinigranum rubrum TaxID=755307 RepID=A0A2I8VK70_9EURY|nr:PAS domain S-box protein [Salinigranum rubrum]AUV82318.1 hybrid sensor histidine kinase/response regulator [Salinigranum rubrum]